MAASRRSFGQIKVMRSGAFQATYTAKDGSRPSIGTFPTRKKADAALAQVQMEIASNTWNDPKRGDIEFGKYAAELIEDRKLAVRTKDNYRDGLRLYLNPTFEHTPINQIDVRAVDKWFAKEDRKNIPSATRNAYTVLRMVMTNAVRQGFIASSPCKVQGLKKLKTKERPYMSPADVLAIADEMQPHLRPIVLLAFGAALRFGEVVALNRKDVDLETGTVTVNKQIVLSKGGSAETPTKTNETRKIQMLSPVLDALKEYLDARPTKFGYEPLFTGLQGKRIHRTHFAKKFREARERAGKSQFVFHDNRHAALTMYANDGGTLKELMARGGHSSLGAALIYQQIAAEHTTEVLDRSSDKLAALLKK